MTQIIKYMQLLFSILLSLIVIDVRAQSATPPISCEAECEEVLGSELGLDFTYNYNPVSCSQLYADVRYKNYLAAWVDAEVGLHFQTNDTYAILLRGDFKWHLDAGSTLELRNQYLYNIYAKYDSQSINALLAIAYNQDYFYGAVGVSTQVFMPLSYDVSSSSVWEPLQFCYDIEASIFPRNHNWNLAFQLTNISPFLVERMYSPNFVVKGRFSLADIWGLPVELKMKMGVEPAGIFHIYSENYEFFFGAGIRCFF